MEVICAIIIEGKKVLVAQRSIYMTLPLKWEFPGGKKQPNETNAECLQRELFEELNIQVIVKDRFMDNKHQYKNFEIHLIAYFAEIEVGTILLYEHGKVGWFSKDQLNNLEWAPADIPIVDSLMNSPYI
jgi:8-oxo-dGTP diphosphatase